MDRRIVLKKELIAIAKTTLHILLIFIAGFICQLIFGHKADLGVMIAIFALNETYLIRGKLNERN